MIPLSLKIKCLIPGYRAKWRQHYSVLLAHLHKLAPQLRCGSEEDMPWMEFPGESLRFYGFWTGLKEYEQLYCLGRILPSEIPPEYFRLAKDYVTRFLYPHMRPDLQPPGLTPDNGWGFHGQHKETLADYAGGDKAFLAKVFTPFPGEIVIDAGCFVGMGDIHLSRMIGEQGRIIAVEADRDCYARLLKNLKYNGVANVAPLHRALWNTVSLIEMESGPAQANTLIESVRKGEEKQPVETIFVDKIVEDFGLKKLDLLSMTINGAEVEALAGARKALQTLRPLVRLPGWYHREGRPIWQHAQEILGAHAYRVFHTPRGNVLAVPEERFSQGKHV